MIDSLFEESRQRKAEAEQEAAAVERKLLAAQSAARNTVTQNARRLDGFLDRLVSFYRESLLPQIKRNGYHFQHEFQRFSGIPNGSSRFANGVVIYIDQNEIPMLLGAEAGKHYTAEHELRFFAENPFSKVVASYHHRRGSFDLRMESVETPFEFDEEKMTNLFARFVEKALRTEELSGR